MTVCSSPEQSRSRRVYSLLALMVSAQNKYGTEAAMKAAAAAKSAKVVAGRQAAAGRRQQELAEGLRKQGTQLT